MICLGLDISGRTGWAVMGPGAAPQFGAYETAGNSPAAKAAFSDWLDGLIRRTRPRLVVVEAPVVTKPRKAEGRSSSAGYNFKAWYLRGVAEAVVGAHRVELREVQPATLKKFGAGSGRADKPAMIRAAQMLYGVALGPKQDDEADALHLAAYGRQTLGRDRR